MNPKETIDWVDQNFGTLLLAGWSVMVAYGFAKYDLLPRLQSKRSVEHSPEYLASKAKADESMARALTPAGP